MAQRRYIQAHFRRRYPTADDWHPNFPRNTVEIVAYSYHNTILGADGMIRVVVRGADDTLMERDERLSPERYAARLEEIRLWLDHKLPNPLTQNWLKSQGFSFA